MDLLHDQGLLAISNVDFYVDTQNVPTHWIAEKVSPQSYQEHSMRVSILKGVPTTQDQKLELGNPIRQDGLLCHREGDSMNKTLNIYGSDEDPPTIEVHGPGKLV